jgi:hypothetical protein
VTGNYLLRKDLSFDLPNGGRIVLELALAIGAHAEVWRCRMDRVGASPRPVVLRLLRTPTGNGMAWPERMKRFRDGYERAAAHPDLFPGVVAYLEGVHVSDTGQERRAHPAMVMEFVAGGTLRQALFAAGGRPRPTLDLLTAELRRVVHLHALGVWHGDLSGMNVLLRNESWGDVTLLFIDLDGAHDEADPVSDLNLGGQPWFFIPTPLVSRNTPEQRACFDVYCAFTEVKVALLGGIGTPGVGDELLHPVLASLVARGQALAYPTAADALAAVEDALAALPMDPGSPTPGSNVTTDVPLGTDVPSPSPADPAGAPVGRPIGASRARTTDIPDPGDGATGTRAPWGIPVRPTAGYVLPTRPPRATPPPAEQAAVRRRRALAAGSLLVLVLLLGHVFASGQSAAGLAAIHGANAMGRDLRSLREPAEATAAVRGILARATLPLRLARYADPWGATTGQLRAEHAGLACRLHVDDAACADAADHLVGLLDARSAVAADAGRALLDLDTHARACPLHANLRLAPALLLRAASAWAAVASGEELVTAQFARAQAHRDLGAAADARADLAEAEALVSVLPDEAAAARLHAHLVEAAGTLVTGCEASGDLADDHPSLLLAGACGALALDDARGARLRFRRALGAHADTGACRPGRDWRPTVLVALADLDHGLAPHIDPCPTLLLAAP